MHCGPPLSKYVCSSARSTGRLSLNIPGVNDTDAHFAFAGRVIAAHPNIERYEILPYHTIGVQKWAGVGRSYTLKELPAATKEQAQAWNARLAEAIRAAQA